MAGEVEEPARETDGATQDVDQRVRSQDQVDDVVQALREISSVVQEIDRTRAVIGEVLTEQSSVTRAILG